MPTLKGAAVRIKRIFARPEWVFAGENWRDAERNLKPSGWGARGVCAAYSNQTPAPLPPALSEPLTRALETAAQSKTKLSVLDFGGNFGAYREWIGHALPGVEIEYTCFDLPEYGEAIAKFKPDLNFVSDKNQLGEYDFVLASGVLQYSRDWQNTLALLSNVTRGHLFLSRHFTVCNVPSFLILQRAYKSSWLGWCFNHSEFLGVARACELRLISDEILRRDTPNIKGAPEKFHKRALLFSR